MKPIYLSIQQQETGANIRRLLKTNGYTVKDVQEVMGFENPQAVYKWLSGKSLPNLENLMILSKLLNISIENILVIDEDINILQSINTQWYKSRHGSWLIYGHIHGARDEVYEFMKTRERALNAGACINNYTPVSFNELVRNNKAFQEKDS